MKTELNPFNKKETSSAYGKTDEVYKKSAEAIIKFQKPDHFGEDSLIVDLGAGTGVSTLMLLENGANNVTLVDPSRPMLEEAEAKLEDKVNYLCASAENFYGNFSANVDMVYALNSIHLFQNMTEALAGIACALKEGGLFVFNISAPTYSFMELDGEEKALIKANLDFYKALNAKVSNEVLAHTIELLEKTLDGGSEIQYTHEKLINILKAVNFEYLDSDEIYIEVDSNYQKNIWRMIAQGYIEDSNEIEDLISKQKLGDVIKIRQAQFKFENLNKAVVS